MICSCQICIITNKHKLSTSQDILNSKNYEHIHDTVDSDYMEFIYKNKKVILKQNKDILNAFNKDCISINQSDDEYKNKTSFTNMADIFPSIKMSDYKNSDYIENIFIKSKFNFKIKMFPNYVTDLEQNEMLHQNPKTIQHTQTQGTELTISHIDITKSITISLIIKSLWIQ